MLILPNNRTGPAPVFVGLNFCGNHELVNETNVPIPYNWFQSLCAGVVDNKATEAGRGKDINTWTVHNTVERGYGLAAVTYGQIEADYNNSMDGVRALYNKTFPGQYTWGAIEAWAWGISCIIDYLVTDYDIDSTRIASVGHSRLGKAAIVAAAFDERIALAIPSEAGCGGTAPSRSTEGESVKDINSVFPYWFSPEFHLFNNQVTKLPFDQHSLISLVAPRPVLLLCAVNDTWSNPPGQFQMLLDANPVYLLLNTTGITVKTMPPVNVLVDSVLGYVIRPGVHSMTPLDWGFYLNYTDVHFKMTNINRGKE